MANQSNDSAQPLLLIRVNGQEHSAIEGETLAAVLLKSDILAFNQNRFSEPRAPLCNMGTCFECLVGVRYSTGGSLRRVRACMTDVTNGMEVFCGVDFSSLPDLDGTK